MGKNFTNYNRIFSVMNHPTVPNLFCFTYYRPFSLGKKLVIFLPGFDIYMIKCEPQNLTYNLLSSWRQLKCLYWLVCSLRLHASLQNQSCFCTLPTRLLVADSVATHLPIAVPDMRRQVSEYVHEISISKRSVFCKAALLRKPPHLR